MAKFVEDLRFALRSLKASPAYVLGVAMTLALAIGANAVIYSFVHVLVLRPLPVREEDRVGFVRGSDLRRGEPRTGVSEADYLDLAQQVRSFESLAAYRGATVTWTGDGEPERLLANRATGSFFEAWGLTPEQGRFYGPDEDRPGAAPVVVLSDRFWRERLGGRSDAIGRSLVLDGTPHIVIGVLGPEIEFGSLSIPKVWVPLRLDPRTAARTERTLRVSGHLAPGATVADASAEVSAIAARLEQQHPDTNAGWQARVLLTRDAMVGPSAWAVLTLLMIVVVAVLVVGCANAANLVLARASMRRRELAVRTALGAGRFRLVRQLLTESLLVSLLAGILGLGIAAAGMRVIRASAAEPIFELVRMSVPVLLFTLGLALVTPLIFSLLPALRVSRADPVEALKAGGRGSTGAGRRHRQLLVVSQLALACSLLILAVTVVRTVRAISQVDLGFDPRDLLTLRVELPEDRYPDAATRRAFYQRGVTALAALPGATVAGGADTLPQLDPERVVPLSLDGVAAASPENRPWASARRLGSRSLAALGLPLLQGRDLGPGDTGAQARVALVSRTFAQRYWPGADPLGRRVSVLDAEGHAGAPIEIVGVTGDLAPNDVEKAPLPTLFLPLEQEPPASAILLVRASSPATLAAAARRTLRELDAELPIDTKTMAAALDEQRSSDRTLTGMFAAFALIALLMAGAGLYAVVSYSVAQRTRELGIRMALGAGSGNIRRMVLGEAFRPALVSLGLGLAGGYGLCRSIERLLYGVSPGDPLTYAAVAALLAAVFAAGTTLPAWRATRLEPIRSLRIE